jgi:hypothetical protein
MKKIHIFPEGIIKNKDLLTVSATIEDPNGTRQLLWYRLPSEYAGAISPSCDPLVLATIFKAMAMATDVVIHGQVSPSILRNLSEYQAVWKCWCPGKYQPVEIIADQEQDYSHVT